MKNKNAMEKEEMINKCRYYKGEKENPYEGNEAMFWDYELRWIEMEEQSHYDHATRQYLETTLEEYKFLGLEEFSKDDNTPITLKSILFNRYGRTAYSARDAAVEFRKFYKKEYLK